MTWDMRYPPLLWSRLLSLNEGEGPHEVGGVAKTGEGRVPWSRDDSSCTASSVRGFSSRSKVTSK